jgi:hypothetical protein
MENQLKEEGNTFLLQSDACHHGTLHVRKNCTKDNVQITDCVTITLEKNTLIKY